MTAEVRPLIPPPPPGPQVESIGGPLCAMKIPKSKDSKQGGDGGGGAGGGGPVWSGGWGSIDLGFIRSMPTVPPSLCGGRWTSNRYSESRT